MAEQKTFDAVTVIGIIVAVGMLIFGNIYLRDKHERDLQEWRKTHPPTQQIAPADQKPETVSGSKSETPAAGQAQAGGTKSPETTPPSTAAEPAAAPDVTVNTDKLSVVLTATGAAIRDVTLNNIYVEAAKKAKTGMEVLSIIDPLRVTAAMPTFEIGPVDVQKQTERVIYDAFDGPRKALACRVWKLERDSGEFDKDGKRTVLYSLTLDKQCVVTKTFTFQKDREYIGIDVGVTNSSGAAESFNYTINGPGGVLLDGPKENPKTSGYVTIRAALAGRDAPLAGRTADSPDVSLVDAATAAKGGESTYVSREENLWGVVKNRFFMAMLISLEPAQLNKISAIEVRNRPGDPDKRLAEPNIGIVGQRKVSAALEPAQSSAGDRYALYVGPSSESQMALIESQLKPAQPLYLDQALQYCDIFNWRWPRVDWVASKLLSLFHGVNTIFGNYGISVVLLTLIIKLALHPTQRKATISMSKMQKLQPELKKIQDRYKGQTTNEARTKMYQETQDLYKKAGVNPAGGCLPMLIQLPILTALYGVFSRAYEIRGAEFMWIKDLSQPDDFLNLPFWPHVLNLLPIIYLVLQLIQMKFAPQQPPSDDPQQEMNRKMMSWMPVVFTFMFYTMPAGLMIYFASSAIFSMIETWYIRKIVLPKMEAAR